MFLEQFARAVLQLCVVVFFVIINIMLKCDSAVSSPFMLHL